MQVFEYVIVKNEKRDDHDNIVEKAEILAGPTTVLALTQEQATLLAGREIKEDDLEDLERITLAVRPF